MTKLHPWKNNKIQFARLITEAEMAGAFTNKVIQDMATSMNLTVDDIWELINRSSLEFEKIKNTITNYNKYKDA